MDPIGFVAGHMLWWLAGAIVCAIISLLIIARSGWKAVRHVSKKGLDESIDELADEPYKKGFKPLLETLIGYYGFHIVTAIFWFIFVISLAINTIVWIIRHAT